jgi:hypothetical protein
MCNGWLSSRAQSRAAIRKKRAKMVVSLATITYEIGMDSTEIERLVWLSETRNVAVVHWPDEADEATRLGRQGLPCLLLVRPDTAPPISERCLEDWLVLPATDIEIQTRLINLARRAARHSHPPTVDHLGQVTHRGMSVFLPPTDLRVMQALVEKFGAIVTEPELVEKVWPDGASNQVLRAHVSRLRHRLAPIGLTIKCVRNAGYLIAEANAS